MLGRGGMGVVYRARDPRLDRSVAIKVLPPELTRDAPAKHRFLQEAKAASALDHPNICNIHEINETEEGELYLVMAHYEGETLKERIARGALAAAEALDIATQVGRGLAEAHAAGIVHRDIKPANLLISKSGAIKILDFGLAKLAGSEGVTVTGTTVGTVSYMSPEQTRGEEVDNRSDVWALGVVLYEMLTGEQPFRGDNLLSISNAIREQQPPPLRDEASVVDGVVRRALEKRQHERYQGVSELLDDLGQASREVTSSANVAAEGDMPSIAVLPFDNMSADPEQRYFCEGMAEEIINALTALEGLHVPSRTSAFQAKAKDLAIGEIGSRLGVGTVLEGSVRKAGNRLRVTAQLINVSDGYHLWSERYDRELNDVFAVQDEIARSVVGQLRVKLLGETDAPLVARPTDNLEAYDSYTMGRHYRFVRYDAGKARECFARAVELDPSYAAAHAGLADAATMQAFLALTSSREASAAARPAATRALSLDDGLSEAHDATARVRFWFDWDWAGAEREFRRALELNPANAETHCGYAICLVFLLRPDDALAQLRRAQDVDPLSPYAAALTGLSHCVAGRYDEAIAACRHALELAPNFPLALWYLVNVHLLMARPEEALAIARSVPEPIARMPYHLMLLGQALGASGNVGDVRRLLRTSVSAARSSTCPRLSLPSCTWPSANSIAPSNTWSDASRTAIRSWAPYRWTFLARTTSGRILVSMTSSVGSASRSRRADRRRETGSCKA